MSALLRALSFCRLFLVMTSTTYMRVRRSCYYLAIGIAFFIVRAFILERDRKGLRGDICPPNLSNKLRPFYGKLFRCWGLFGCEFAVGAILVRFIENYIAGRAGPFSLSRVIALIMLLFLLFDFHHQRRGGVRLITLEPTLKAKRPH
jgi:hypothetical protein